MRLTVRSCTLFKLRGPRCKDTSSSAESAWALKPPIMDPLPRPGPVANRGAIQQAFARLSVCTVLLVQCFALYLNVSAITRARLIALTGTASLLTGSRGWGVTEKVRCYVYAMRAYIAFRTILSNLNQLHLLLQNQGAFKLLISFCNKGVLCYLLASSVVNSTGVWETGISPRKNWGWEREKFSNLPSPIFLFLVLRLPLRNGCLWKLYYNLFTCNRCANTYFTFSFTGLTRLTLHTLCICCKINSEFAFVCLL